MGKFSNNLQSLVLNKMEMCECGLYIFMSKVDECICFKEIGVTQAESETGDHLCIMENPILIATFCLFQCVKICSIFGPGRLDDKH